ncbi:MAG: Fe-S cluster assembly protein SufD [Bacteroidales bacterium OttesenSCG-928-I14]|jgi:Fe-S cluster assembly protein SufD|nr:Fe-S cluster assembly protein SufD [Bacteroidales bacterium OttesenSCG-928-I14]
MKRYIDLFREKKIIIDRFCNPLLNFFRKKAFENFQKFVFCYNSKDYNNTHITAFLGIGEMEFEELLKVKIDPHIVFCCGIPYLNSYTQHFVLNGYCLSYKIKKYEQKKSFNFFSGSLNKFAEQYPNVFLKYYNKQSDFKGDILSAFNTMFIQDGYVLYIPKNVIVEDPIQLNSMISWNVNLLVNKRILIILEERAQAKLFVCDHTINNESFFSFVQVVEIYLEKQAVFDFYELEKNTKKTIRLTQSFVSQMDGSKLTTSTITLNNFITRNKYIVDLNSECAESNIHGLTIIDEKQKIDNFVVINHNAPKCSSNSIHKYVLDDESVGSFSGKITVANNACKTKAYQSNRNILSSDTCQMYSNPQLEINVDNVDCSHGASTGYLDELALFYMRSRGIPNNDANYLLKLAFISDILKEIKMKELKNQLQLLVNKYFKKKLTKC